MPTYMTLADVHEQEFQNPQELATVWGDVAADIEEIGGELRHSYAVMGAHDFVLIYEVDDSADAMQVAIAAERYGMDTTSMQLFPIDRLSELVEDI
ncbi:GYD domain-containing protein [Halosimplex salinum]|uniref:GYD domain-containing protein n=1 Tax=Halosimplex salinum TaxID=1710538 RepID=UPI000F48EC10|nr:GYD domain-containing protein [Halosimplex salinum]